MVILKKKCLLQMGILTKKSQKMKEKMGENENFVFNTGCPSIDLAKEVLDNPKLDFDPIVNMGEWERI